ncbi:MAG: phenylalanine--tRNA ligase subunit alpha [Bacteroidota bacterium]|nr:phenylalanine--tRNA ligase subunit alpha [Bacteroidota bacterium]
MDLLEKITGLEREVASAKAQNSDEVERLRIGLIGRNGSITALFELFKEVTPEEKRTYGQRLNQLKKAAQQKIDELKSSAESSSAPTASSIDLSAPSLTEFTGSLHPITIVRQRIIDIFSRIGYGVSHGPEVEDDHHNFSALNFPPDHPARDMQDTFFVSLTGLTPNPSPGERGEGLTPGPSGLTPDPSPGERGIIESVSPSAAESVSPSAAESVSPSAAEDWALRTHTSSVQVRVMENSDLPIRTISPGRVYRNEAISARAHCMFHQVEALYVDKGVSFAELKGTIDYFVKALFGQDVSIRLRPSYFPFTEPSAEVDMSCSICGGTGCNICKHSGWVEIMGCGMVDPAVLTNCGIDPEVYSGFALGMGIERITQLLYRVPDLRMYWENDVRFLDQFTAATFRK